ncbi:ArnT family glycosyltransferase [Chitinophaga agri]|uniref:Glycosyltransferase family 39 protein n=1 Tax=Chitinophaga agri TaxID=2703787 RepID=A0A6B9ZI33_9BACT|nr:glycosyltransferase family 39 protein [Chitinophaga agri]QHS61419.1 glycosyltransferase family 39 protein [Chitinophaga agri]
MPKRSYLLLIALIAFKLTFHFSLVHPDYDLHRDEYLHLEQANHLAAGYLSVPPFTAFLSLLIKWLGGGVYWVRFFPALFGALTMLVIWKLVELLKGGWYAQLLAAVVFICSGMSRINILYQPNSADILAWTLIFYLVILYIRDVKPQWLLWMGVVAGMAFLNKYNILFLAAGLLPALLITPQRSIFREKYLYGGLLIALLLALPNIVWQLQNGVPFLHHMKELADTQLVNVERAGFIKEQLLFFLLGSAVWIAGLTALMGYAPYRPYRFAGWTFLLVMALFVYLKAKAYYALGLYPVMLAFGSVYWEHLFSRSWLKYARLGWLVMVILPTVCLFRVIYPVMPPKDLYNAMTPRMRDVMCRWEDGKLHDLPQDFADMRGWRELAGLATMAYQQVPVAERPYTLILCDNYGQAGAINYYAADAVRPAITFSADYMCWFPKMDSLHYLIVVGEAPAEYVRKYTSGYTKTGQINDKLSREYGTGVYLVEGISPVFPRKLYQWQQEEQAGSRSW